MDILESVLNSSSHAIFALDADGIVTHINRQAKENFGLFNHSQQSHSAGRLEMGDLVILATTIMGEDDGGLQQEDLAALGIRDKRIQPGDMLAACVGSCMLSMLAYTASRKGIDSDGICLKARCTEGPRGIASLELDISVPRALPHDSRKILEAAVRSCPVGNAIHPDIEKKISWHWAD